MLNIAIAGLGTVGSGLVRLLASQKDIIEQRTGDKINLLAVSARGKDKRRDCDLSNIIWVADPLGLADIKEVDLIVELMGGAEGKAKDLAFAALKQGKHFVTANKALLARHGGELALLADNKNVQLSFEAAVAGAIPIIKTLKESLCGNRVTSVRGILNGTSNYILTRMEQEGLSFATALADAQSLGYAEADPAADIDGIDTANKLALLSAIAFGAPPAIDDVECEGIRHIVPLDLEFAEELSCRLRLLGVARLFDGKLEQSVAPSLVPKSLPLSQVTGALNAVLVKGDFAGDLMLQGSGAGGNATASAVIADIIDIARGFRSPAFGMPAFALKKRQMTSTAEAVQRYYLRLQVVDKPGVVADVAAILRDEQISIESLIQRGRSSVNSVPVVLVTHEVKASAMRRSALKIAELAAVVEKPCLLPIED